MQYVLRTEQFKELYEKSEFSDYYFEDLFGMEPDYEWRIHQELITGNIPRQIKEAIPYITKFCEQEGVRLKEIIPSFEYDGYNPRMLYSFTEKFGKFPKYKYSGHFMNLDALKDSLEEKI